MSDLGSPWQRGQLRRFAKIVNGGTPSAQPRNWDGQVQWATPVDLAGVDGVRVIATARNITKEGLVSGSAAVPSGSVILSTRAPIGYSARVNELTAFNQGCKGLVPNPGLDVRFLLYLLQASKPELTGLGQGTTFRELSRIALGSLSIEIPSPELQAEIADFLDTETKEVDAFIADQVELIALLTERRGAMISHAVTNGLDPTAQLTDEATELGQEVPSHWRRTPLWAAVRSIESGVSVNAADWPAMEGEKGVLKTSCVSSGSFDPSQNKTVDPFELDRLACPVKTGALIVSRMNTPELVGAAGLVQHPAPHLYLPDRLWQINVRGDARYFHYWTQSTDYRSQVSVAAVGTSASMQNLSQSAFLHFRIALPPLREQCRIADFLAEALNTFDTTIADAREAIALSRERRAALISAAVTGKIDVRGLTRAGEGEAA